MDLKFLTNSNIGSKVRNAKPMRFYGMHFEDGIAQYKDMEGEPVIYISSDTALQMDKTFENKPVFVLHQDNVDVTDIKSADGIVVRSFFNKHDGKHWAEFIVFTQAGLEAIQKGWKLSNGYDIEGKKGGGRWHGADYTMEVTSGNYEHLAIVPNPRYADSIILTPDEFKLYNEKKEAELKRLCNSQGETKMFNLFKKETVQNSDALQGVLVELPTKGITVSVEDLIKNADKAEDDKLANEDKMVELENGEKMTVKELMNKYSNMCKKKNADEEDKPKNEDEEEKAKMKNSIEEEEAKIMEQMKALNERKENFNKLHNAGKDGFSEENEGATITIVTSQSQVARGSAKYGSNK